jgi:putative SOS response-associated peptidase YedK
MAFLTAEPNSIVAPIHPKAMPVLLRTEEEFEIWLKGSADEAKALQRPLPDDALELAFTGQKSDNG